MIEKDGLNFVRLYFLNYTWYVWAGHVAVWVRRGGVEILGGETGGKETTGET